MADIEHHFHAPTAKQVHVALRQYLTDMVPAGEITKKVEQRVDECVSRKIDDLLKGTRIERLICEAVARTMNGETTSVYSAFRDGSSPHIRSIIVEELKKLVTRDYEIVVTKKGTTSP